MRFFGFRYAHGAWNVNDGWHLLGSLTFDLKHVMAFANKDEDGCSIDRIEHDENDKRYFKVHIKDIQRTRGSQVANYKFHLIYSTMDGKLYKQTIKHNKETTVDVPIEIKISDYSITGHL